MSTSLAGYALLDQFYMEYEIALCEYFENRNIILDEDEPHAEDFFHDENEFSRFMSWFCTYHVGTGGKTFPESYLMENGKILTDLEKEILASYSDSYPGLYEVQRVKPWNSPRISSRMKSISFTNLTFQDHVQMGPGKGGLLHVRTYFLSGFDPVIVPPRCESTRPAGDLQSAGASDMKNFFRKTRRKYSPWSKARSGIL